MTKEKVVIIIPTYNESLVIQETIIQLFQAVDSVLNHDIHILIFDSASQDGTAELVLALQAQYPSLHFRSESSKSGLGSAYLQAMRYAMDVLSADIIFEFDADLSHQPQYIAPMLEKLQRADVVIGSRYVQGGSIPSDWAWHRKFFSIAGNYISRLVLTPHYKDFTSGFRATRRQWLEKILPSKFLSSHYAYKLHLLWLLHKAKAKIIEFPIAFIDRKQGESKLPKNSILDSLRVIFTLRFYELQRYLTMCMVGCVGTGIQFAVYNVFRLQLSPLHASQLALLAAIVNNFIWNDLFTFRRKTDHMPLKKRLKINRWLVFASYSLVMIWLQSSWLQWGVHHFGRGVLKENMILAIGLGLGSLLNYFTYSRHIWPESKLAN